MTPTAMTIAMIMTASWSTKPTAVMTESSEKTMSMRPIWMMTLRNPECFGAWPFALFTLEAVVNLEGRLREQEQAAADENEVAAGDFDVAHGEQRRLKPHDPRQQ